MWRCILCPAPVLSNGMHAFVMTGKAQKITSAVGDPSQNEQKMSSQKVKMSSQKVLWPTADRRKTLRMPADELNMGKDTVHKISRDNLWKRKICSLFMPHFLTDDQKQCRLEACWDLIDATDRYPSFLQSDRSWQGTDPGVTSRILKLKEKVQSGDHHLLHNRKKSVSRNRRWLLCLSLSLMQMDWYITSLCHLIKLSKMSTTKLFCSG